MKREEFQSFCQEFRELMQKYGFRVKEGYESIDTSAFIVIRRPTPSRRIPTMERDVCISFTELLSYREALEIEKRGEATITRE